MKKLNLSVNTNLVDISPLYKMESLTDLILNGATIINVYKLHGL